MRLRSRINYVSEKRDLKTTDARNGKGDFGRRTGECWQAAVDDEAESRRIRSGLRLLAFTSAFDDDEGDSTA
jgi:hypothetical protein